MPESIQLLTYLVRRTSTRILILLKKGRSPKLAIILPIADRNMGPSHIQAGSNHNFSYKMDVARPEIVYFSLTFHRAASMQDFTRMAGA